jgi:hypothetical protein
VTTCLETENFSSSMKNEGEKSGHFQKNPKELWGYQQASVQGIQRRLRGLGWSNHHFSRRLWTLQMSPSVAFQTNRGPVLGDSLDL